MSRAHAYQDIRSRSLELVDEHRLDAMTDVEDMRAVVLQAVEEYQRRASLGDGRTLGDPVVMVDRVMSSLAEFGPLTSLLSRSDVEEIFIEGTRVRFIDGTGRLGVAAENRPRAEGERTGRSIGCSPARIDDWTRLRRCSCTRVWTTPPGTSSDAPDRRPEMSVAIKLKVRAQKGDVRVDGGTRLSVASDSLVPAVGDADVVECSDLLDSLARARRRCSPLSSTPPAAHCIRCCGGSENSGPVGSWIVLRSSTTGPPTAPERSRCAIS